LSYFHKVFNSGFNGGMPIGKIGVIIRMQYTAIALLLELVNVGAKEYYIL